MSGLDIITNLYNSQKDFLTEWYPHYSEETKDEVALKLTRNILNLFPDNWIEVVVREK